MVRSRLHRLLLDRGVTEAEISRAEADETLDLLVVDTMLFPTSRRYSQQELADRTGLPLLQLRRLWRALGFFDVGESERVFTDLDVEAGRFFRQLLDSHVVELEPAVQLARVIGSSMARIAEAEVLPRVVTSSGPEDPLLAADAFSTLGEEMIPAVGRLLEFVWRRHLQATTRRMMYLRRVGHLAGTSPVLAVGFVDMVGFTRLSEDLPEPELAETVKMFEEISYDIVTHLGGRVVKTMGDEAMFVVDGVVPAANIGLELTEAFAVDVLCDVRVGLAVGTVITRDGDYFGPTVNLAHRIVTIADPGAVLMPERFWSALHAESGEAFTGEALDPRELKDLGRVQLWRLGRAGHGTTSRLVQARRGDAPGAKDERAVERLNRPSTEVDDPAGA